MGDYTEHLITQAGGDGDALDLDAIQARADAATEGPWARPLNTRYRASVTADMPKGDPSSRWRDQVDHEGKPERVTIVSCPIWSDGKFYRKQSGRDLEFIAHSRMDVPALLALVREQQARIGRVEAVHEPKSWTKYGIPCFDEFDSPTARINGCTCGNEHYPCPTIVALTATDEQ